MRMKLWLTYAWVDNENKQVDFVEQELQRAGLEVGLDRTRLVPGKRLWPQIANQISLPSNSDAWGIVVSRASLASEPCQEELAYALDRALRARDEAYPIIGIFLEPVHYSLVPPALRTRLYTDISAPDWIERVKAGVEQRPPAAGTTASLQPYIISRHDLPDGKIVIDVRPRAGRWRPVIAAVPVAEESILNMVRIGEPGRPTVNAAARMITGPTEDGALFRMANIDAAATPHDSAHIVLSQLPSLLIFGSEQEYYELTRAQLQSL